MVKIVPLAIPL